jgi:hypothetical protein
MTSKPEEPHGSHRETYCHPVAAPFATFSRQSRRMKPQSQPLSLVVLGLINHTHSATAKFFYDTVMGDRLTDHGAMPCYAGGNGKSMRANGLTAERNQAVKRIALRN